MSENTKRPPRRYPVRLSQEAFETLYLSIIRSELRQGLPLPTATRLIELGYPVLPAEIRGHGGRQIVLKRLGYWSNPDRAYEIIEHLCAHGYLPTPTTFCTVGFKNILSVIHGQYGVEAFAHRYGLRCWKTEELQERILHRQRAAGRLIAAFARKHRRLPRHDELGKRTENIARHSRGVTFLLRNYLKSAKHVPERASLATLHGPKKKTKYRGVTQKKLARALWPYVRRWIRSGGQISITAMIHEDMRWDLRHLISRRGGIRTLLTKKGFFPQRAMRLLWLSYVEQELLRLAPKEFRRGILPPRSFFLRNAPALEHTIHRRCGGYRAVAAALGMQTRRDAKQVAVRHRALSAILRHALVNEQLPTVEQLGWRDRRLVSRDAGLLPFLATCAFLPRMRGQMHSAGSALVSRYQNGYADAKQARHTGRTLLLLTEEAEKNPRTFCFR